LSLEKGPEEEGEKKLSKKFDMEKGIKKSLVLSKEH
jgi:hypothetical protein